MSPWMTSSLILDHAPFSPSPITYRHLTKGLVDSDRIQDAMDLLHEMLNRGHAADSLIYNTLMGGFIDGGNMDKALELFDELFDELRERCLVYDGVVHATLMEGYWKRGMDKDAMESYQSLLDRQFKMITASCNTLMETLRELETTLAEFVGGGEGGGGAAELGVAEPAEGEEATRLFREEEETRLFRE